MGMGTSWLATINHVPGSSAEAANLTGFGTGVMMVDVELVSATAGVSGGVATATSTGGAGSAGVATATGAGGVGGTGKPPSTGAVEATVVGSAGRELSMARHLATLALCSSRVLAKAWPPEPSATK